MEDKKAIFDKAIRLTEKELHELIHDLTAHVNGVTNSDDGGEIRISIHKTGIGVTLSNVNHADIMRGVMGLKDALDKVGRGEV